jgi:hypothetical protein
VPETDHPAWNPATSYTVGDRVIRATTHKVYEAILAGVNAGLPENTSARWVAVGSTNRWRMLDSEVGSVTSASGSLTVVLSPGYATALALLEVDAQSIAVEVRDTSGAIIYSTTRSLDPSVLLDWYAYFFTDPVSRSEIVFPGLYIGTGYTVSVTLTGATVECGALVIGEATDLGATEYGATLGIVDYSRKETDEFGVVTITRRKYAKRLTAKLAFERERTNRVFRTLAALRSTPCVYVTSDALDYESLTVFGFYKDFRIDVAYPTHHYCTLDIEGLI